MTTEFICKDCGEWVWLVAPDEGKEYLRCGPCQWLHEANDPRLRAYIRKLTHRRDMNDDTRGESKEKD